MNAYVYTKYKVDSFHLTVGRVREAIILITELAIQPIRDNLQRLGHERVFNERH